MLKFQSLIHMYDQLPCHLLIGTDLGLYDWGTNQSACHRKRMKLQIEARKSLDSEICPVRQNDKDVNKQLPSPGTLLGFFWESKGKQRLYCSGKDSQNDGCQLSHIIFPELSEIKTEREHQ